jgi:hypothetical protein
MRLRLAVGTVARSPDSWPVRERHWPEGPASRPAGPGCDPGQGAGPRPADRRTPKQPGSLGERDAPAPDGAAHPPAPGRPAAKRPAPAVPPATRPGQHPARPAGAAARAAGAVQRCLRKPRPEPQPWTSPGRGLVQRQSHRAAPCRRRTSCHQTPRCQSRPDGAPACHLGAARRLVDDRYRVAVRLSAPRATHEESRAIGVGSPSRKSVAVDHRSVSR